MKQTNKRRAILGATGTLLAIAISGCGGSDGGSGVGSVSIGITDSPAEDVSLAVVQFSGISLKPAGGEVIDFTFDPAIDVDLVAMAGGNMAGLLNNEQVPAGRYNWVRLAVNTETGVRDSYAMINGQEVELDVPSGDQTGLKLVSGFTVLQDASSNFVIDWDLRKALHDPQGQDGIWFLRPALRITDLAEFGTLFGTIDMDLIDPAAAEGGCPNETEVGTGSAVYVYTGFGITPGEIGETTDSAIAPLATGSAELNADNMYTYEVNFLPPGDYTVAFTCQADADLVDTDEDIVFATEATVVITADMETELNLPDPL